jgi:hypothetical protein
VAVAYTQHTLDGNHQIVLVAENGVHGHVKATEYFLFEPFPGGGVQMRRLVVLADQEEVGRCYGFGRTVEIMQDR